MVTPFLFQIFILINAQRNAYADLIENAKIEQELERLYEYYSAVELCKKYMNPLGMISYSDLSHSGTYYTSLHRHNLFVGHSSFLLHFCLSGYEYRDDNFNEQYENERRRYLMLLEFYFSIRFREFNNLVYDTNDWELCTDFNVPGKKSDKIFKCKACKEGMFNIYMKCHRGKRDILVACAGVTLGKGLNWRGFAFVNYGTVIRDFVSLGYGVIIGNHTYVGLCASIGNSTIVGSRCYLEDHARIGINNILNHNVAFRRNHKSSSLDGLDLYKLSEINTRNYSLRKHKIARMQNGNIIENFVDLVNYPDEILSGTIVRLNGN